MAVTQTGAMYKSLTFDNKTSREYGVYITGEAVYNAPERDVEMITIPGRNGSFALDNGRFENIEVSYPAGIFAETEADFRQAISDFRNYLCSRKGYCRLTDEYNPSEYRMAVYKSGLEVDPAQLRAGEFNITFECKPQRWLTSGETEVTIASSGDTITNPTLFESSPLLKVWGYGDIGIANSEIAIANSLLGKIILSDVRASSPNLYRWTFGSALVNVGDPIVVQSVKFTDEIQLTNVDSIDNISITTIPTTQFPNATAAASLSGIKSVSLDCNVNNYEWAYTTTSSTIRGTFIFTITYTKLGVQQTGTIKLNKEITINDNSGYIKSYSTNVLEGAETYTQAISIYSGQVVGDSTVSALGNPTYIDCDLGEAYKYENGVPVSLNHLIDLGSDLPVLASGSNAITFDNTITSFKIVPRWWKV